MTSTITRTEIVNIVGGKLQFEIGCPFCETPFVEDDEIKTAHLACLLDETHVLSPLHQRCWLSFVLDPMGER